MCPQKRLKTTQYAPDRKIGDFNIENFETFLATTVPRSRQTWRFSGISCHRAQNSENFGSSVSISSDGSTVVSGSPWREVQSGYWGSNPIGNFGGEGVGNVVDMQYSAITNDGTTVHLFDDLDTHAAQGNIISTTYVSFPKMCMLVENTSKNNCDYFMS